MLNARDASYWPRAVRSLTFTFPLAQRSKANPHYPKIAAEHEKLVGVDPASAKKAYLQMASELPFYGHLPFIISVRFSTALLM
jgi:hypothetical protein